MSLADEMRAKTQQSRKASEDEERRTAEEKRLRREAVLKEAQDVVPATRAFAIEEINSAALGGHNSIIFFVGEINDLDSRNYRSDYTYRLRQLLTEQLRNDGFIVKGRETRDRRPRDPSVGNDPYLFDPYTEISIEISW